VELQAKLESWSWSDDEIRAHLEKMNRTIARLDAYEREFIACVVFTRRNDKLTRPQREFALRTFMKFDIVR
jgi:hypothetical protein